MDLINLPVDHLFGDWCGLRTGLEDCGITPSLTFESDLAGNPVGGFRHGFTDADNLGLNVNFDLDKICGLKGGSFFVSMSQRSGANLSAIDVGNTFTTQQVYGRETYQLINVDYSQKILDDKVELRVAGSPRAMSLSCPPTTTSSCRTPSTATRSAFSSTPPA